tara:strand:+ start:50 stop:838 length:789 start_codon:yes stop_codon:yes gene_type:complete
MQCPECGYISFKIEKDCGACGLKFKKNQKSTSLSANGPLSFFDLFLVKEEEKIQEDKENSVESIGILEAPEREPFINPETGDFNLDLVEIEDNKIENAQASSDQNLDLNREISIYKSLGFGRSKDIYLEKTEVESLDLESFQTTKEEITEETQSIKAEPYSIEKSKNSDETSFLEPALEIEEPLAPELDLGENEDKLDLSYEPIPPNEADPASSLSDLPNLNLEIDNSDRSFITKSNEIAGMEIKDLGLELESSDEPEKDKS